MFVFLFMARETITWRIFVTRCFMTTFARNTCVPPRQCKAGRIVVKLGNLPRPVAMALFALGSCLPFVLVVFFVTTETVSGGVAKTLQIFMARRAFHR
jgi:hypothetical protein